MRSGFKLAAAGLALVLGCASCALSPVESPVSDAAPAAAVAQDAQGAAGADVAVSRASVVGSGAEVPSPDVHLNPNAVPTEPESAALRAAVGGVQYRDGVYHASSLGWQDSVPVTVTVSRGKIESIVVGQNAEAAAMADKAQGTVVPQIIETQSTSDIDLATGATHTSQAIVDAVALALSHALVA